MTTSFAAAAAAILAFGLLACSERERSGSIAFRVSSRHVPTSSSAAPHRLSTEDGAVAALGPDTIIVRRAQVVLSDIQLGPASSGECDSGEEDEEPCTRLATGPVLVTLPLGDTTEQRISAAASSERFILFHLAIHRPDPQRDSLFIAAHPDFAGVSIRVAGTYSRSGARRDFLFVSDFSEQQEVGLLPPLIVPPGATAMLTLRLDLATWFLSANKTALIDPATANPSGPNAGLVIDNIRTSLAVFPGDDRDSLDGHRDPPRAAASPWPRNRDSAALAGPATRAGPSPDCRPNVPRITPDSIGPFRVEATLSELQHACPRLRYSWVADPDGFAVPAATARLGGVIVTALFNDTLPDATVHQVHLAHAGPRTAAGLGVGSTLRDLQRTYGVLGAAEPGCVLRIWFAALPGVAFDMEFPPRERRACGALSDEPLPTDLRVASVMLVPR